MLHTCSKICNLSVGSGDCKQDVALTRTSTFTDCTSATFRNIQELRFEGWLMGIWYLVMPVKKGTTLLPLLHSANPHMQGSKKTLDTVLKKKKTSLWNKPPSLKPSQTSRPPFWTGRNELQEWLFGFSLQMTQRLRSCTPSHQHLPPPQVVLLDQKVV